MVIAQFRVRIVLISAFLGLLIVDLSVNFKYANLLQHFSDCNSIYDEENYGTGNID